jgi:hypothetical protein
MGSDGGWRDMMDVVECGDRRGKGGCLDVGRSGVELVGDEKEKLRVQKVEGFKGKRRRGEREGEMAVITCKCVVVDTY